LFITSVVVVPVMDTVSVEDAGVPDAATVGGEKMHDVPAGKPEQVNETAELNPFSGTTETGMVPGWLEVTVRDVGEAETEKSDAAWLIV
jgi:hypothetical protein